MTTGHDQHDGSHHQAGRPENLAIDVVEAGKQIALEDQKLIGIQNDLEKRRAAAEQGSGHDTHQEQQINVPIEAFQKGPENACAEQDHQPHRQQKAQALVEGSQRTGSEDKHQRRLEELVEGLQSQHAGGKDPIVRHRLKQQGRKGDGTARQKQSGHFGQPPG
ncbi:hypothetical protein DSECCO2_379740 [anaerobic digester metagenome]